MPRPCKRRRICAKPICCKFSPENGKKHSTDCIVMTLDEYEAIRLIDYEGLTQEQCAKQMNVSRTTAQSVYSSARRKTARCLVEGAELIIDGGDYFLCDGSAEKCRADKTRQPRCACSKAAAWGKKE